MYFDINVLFVSMYFDIKVKINMGDIGYYQFFPRSHTFLLENEFLVFSFAIRMIYISVLPFIVRIVFCIISVLPFIVRIVFCIKNILISNNLNTINFFDLASIHTILAIYSKVYSLHHANVTVYGDFYSMWFARRYNLDIDFKWNGYLYMSYGEILFLWFHVCTFVHIFGKFPSTNYRFHMNNSYEQISMIYHKVNGLMLIKIILRILHLWGHFFLVSYS